MPKLYNTLAEFRGAIMEVIENTDFEHVGELKAHLDENKQETGEFYLTATVPAPSGSALEMGGVAAYPSRLQFKLDAFKLRDTPRTSGTATAPAAATANSKTLTERLAATAAIRAANEAKREAERKTKNTPTVVAVAAPHTV